MNVIEEIKRINEQELALGIRYEGSWHQKYNESAWVYVGGIPFKLTEGDILCVMSQFGEIEDINLVRDTDTGKSKGFAFIKYEDQRSTVLAVDNMNGANLLDRIIRVDHVLKYKLPKEIQEKENQFEMEDEVASNDDDEVNSKKSHHSRGLPGHAYEGKELATKYNISHGHNVFASVPKTSKEKKRDRKKEKKKIKEIKKLRKIEAKQTKLMQEIQLKRRKVKEAANQDKDMLIAASSTGWRGRYEPNATGDTQQRTWKDKNNLSSTERRENGFTDFDKVEADKRKSYGGVNRVR